jgi:hypothetical protein
MIRFYLFTGTLWAIVAMFAFGCSGSGVNPVTPTASGNDQLKSQSAPGTSTDRYLWGFWQIEIDPATLEASISENRNAQFNANVTRFLQPPNPYNLKVHIDDDASDVQNSLLACDVYLTHPFVGMNKFRGFDVRGIIMGDWSLSSLHDPTALYPNWFAASPGVAGTEPVLLNADGYTRWWNPTEFTSYGKIFGYTKGDYTPPGYTASATVNGFKYFTDNLGPEDPFSVDPASRGTFSLDPGTNTRRYMLQFVNKQWKYNYAVDASWAQPDPSGAPDYPVTSYPPEANCQEAYKISLADAGSSAWFQSTTAYGGDFTLDVEVYDWQADTSINPSAVLDEVSAIWLESPAFDDGSGNQFLNLLNGTYELLPGTNNTSSIFRVTIDANFASSVISKPGNYPVFITVESVNPDTYEPQIGGGGSAFDFPSAPLTAYSTGLAIVSGISPQQAPVVLSIVPDKGPVNTIVKGVEIHGLNFVDGATVEFLHESGSYSIGPLVATFVDDSLLTLDLDLNGSTIGLYDVTVLNPDTQFGTLPKGFAVLKPTLVLEDEIAFEPVHDGFDNYSPAITVETDNDIVFAFEEYTPLDNHSEASAWKSTDDGATWPESDTSFYSMFGDWHQGDAVKIWPSSYGNSYRTLQLVNNFDDTIWNSGFLGTTFHDVNPYPDGSHVTQDIYHANELLQDAEKYVYTLGDKNKIIKFKRSEVPEYIMGGPSGAIWQNFPTHTIADPGTLSRARSSALFNGTMYLSYYEEENNVIRLASASSDWQTWDTSGIIYQADGVNYAGPRDPGLQVDSTGFYCTFVRLPTNVDHDELCFTYSPDGLTWTNPTVIHQGGDVFNIQDNPVIHYDWNGISVVGVVWWEGPAIWTSFSVDNGLTFSDPILVSESSPQNKQSDLAISPLGNWHFVYAGLDESTTLNKIHYRRGHMEYQ